MARTGAAGTNAPRNLTLPRVMSTCAGTTRPFTRSVLSWVPEPDDAAPEDGPEPATLLALSMEPALEGALEKPPLPPTDEAPPGRDVGSPLAGADSPLEGWLEGADAELPSDPDDDDAPPSVGASTTQRMPSQWLPPGQLPHRAGPLLHAEAHAPHTATSAEKARAFIPGPCGWRR